jgi:hypothetical protein
VDDGIIGHTDHREKTTRLCSVDGGLEHLTGWPLA